MGILRPPCVDPGILLSQRYNHTGENWSDMRWSGFCLKSFTHLGIAGRWFGAFHSHQRHCPDNYSDHHLTKKLRIKIGSEVVVSILKTVTASVAMVIACWFVLKMFPASDGGSLYFKAIRLFAPMTAAFVAFAGTSILLKSEEFGHLVKLSLRKS